MNKEDTEETFRPHDPYNQAGLMPLDPVKRACEVTLTILTNERNKLMADFIVQVRSNWKIRLLLWIRKKCNNNQDVDAEYLLNKAPKLKKLEWALFKHHQFHTAGEIYRTCQTLEAQGSDVVWVNPEDFVSISRAFNHSTMN